MPPPDSDGTVPCPLRHCHPERLSGLPLAPTSQPPSPGRDTGCRRRPRTRPSPRWPRSTEPLPGPPSLLGCVFPDDITQSLRNEAWPLPLWFSKHPHKRDVKATALGVMHPR